MQSAPDQSEAETARLNRYEGAALEQEAANNRTSLNAFNRDNDPYYSTSYDNWPDQTDAESARLNRYEAAAVDQERANNRTLLNTANQKADRSYYRTKPQGAPEQAKLSPQEQAYKTYMAMGGRSSLARIPSESQGRNAPVALSGMQRTQAHALGVYDAGAEAVEGATYSFAVVGTPESRAAWAQQAAKAGVEGIRRFINDPGGSVSGWWDNLTSDDPEAIRQATAQGAGVAMGVGGGVVLGRLQGAPLSRVGNAGNAASQTLSETRNALTSLSSRPLEKNALTLESLGPEPGFSAAYDPNTRNFLAMPSGSTTMADGSAVPGLLPRLGGHATSGPALADLTGSPLDNIFGFGISVQKDGQLSLGFSSGVLNPRNVLGDGTRTVPSTYQAQIIEAIEKATGMTVVKNP